MSWMRLLPSAASQSASDGVSGNISLPFNCVINWDEDNFMQEVHGLSDGNDKMMWKRRINQKSPSMSCDACALSVSSRADLRVAVDSYHRTLFSNTSSSVSRIISCLFARLDEKARMLRRPSLEYHPMTLKIALYKLSSLDFLHFKFKEIWAEVKSAKERESLKQLAVNKRFFITCFN